MGIHANLPDAELHEPKGIVSAVANAVYVALGNGSGEWKDYKPKSVVYAHSEADFPDPVSGVITLANDTTYVLGADITFTSQIQAGVHSAITGIEAGAVTVLYEGTAPLFIGGEGTPFRLRRMTLDCPNAPLFAWSGTTAALNGVVLDAVDVTRAESLGTLNNITTLTITECSLFAVELDGFTFTGSVTKPVIIIDVCETFMAAGDFMDITGVTLRGGRITFFQVVQTDVTPVGGIVSNGTADIEAGSSFIVRDAIFAVDDPLKGGVTRNDVRWSFLIVTGIGDSVVSADAYLDTPQTVVVSASSTYYLIDGGNWQSDILASFTSDATGVVTYVGERPINVLINATSTVSKVGGGSDQIAMRVAKNGTTIPKSTSLTQNVTPTSLASVAILEINPGDTLDLRVANLTATNDIVVDLADITITRVP